MTNQQKIEQLTNETLLESLTLDCIAFSLKHRVWQNRVELYRKWLRYDN